MKKFKVAILINILILLTLSSYSADKSYFKEKYSNTKFKEGGLTAQSLDVKKYLNLNNEFFSNLSGKGVTVALLDSGISPNEFIEDKRIIAFKDLVNNKKCKYDDTGHGTCVAGIIGATGNNSGIAPDVNFVILKVLNEQNQANQEIILKALNWIIENNNIYNINIVNISLGIQPILGYKDDPLCKAVNEIVDKGMMVIVAAGNSYLNSQTVLSPGNSPSAISVGSINNNRTYQIDDDRIATFSNIKNAEGLTKPDIFTLGIEIKSIGNDNKDSVIYKTGTSFSAPIITGVTCLFIEKYRNRSPCFYRELILKNTFVLNDCNQELEFLEFIFIDNK